jgi:hypothetical protein
MSNINFFWGSKKRVARFVEDTAQCLKFGSVLTTITTPGKLGGYFVTTVIDGSSAVIDRLKELGSSRTQVNTYKGNP